jgi:hypothetical protein
MNRTILTVTGALGASSLLLLDSAIKGTVLLALAVVVANPRELNFLESGRTALAIADEETLNAEWHLKPGECGVMRMFTNEGGEDGPTASAGIEGDLNKFDRNHAVAEMQIAKAPAGAWTGKLIIAQTRGSADVAAAPTPMHKKARTLYDSAWLKCSNPRPHRCQRP